MSYIGIALIYCLALFSIFCAVKTHNVLKECCITIPDNKTLSKLIIYSWAFALSKTLVIVIAMIELKIVVIGN